ncbi:hypothetical protein BDN67DRAFT_984924 [Paxillus ammoniavirescens]|nr:hypothetical protein BDN67DRAFT_984924 [Paxillus ammoniavirescens]
MLKLCKDGQMGVDGSPENCTYINPMLDFLFAATDPSKDDFSPKGLSVHGGIHIEKCKGGVEREIEIEVEANFIAGLIRPFLWQHVRKRWHDTDDTAPNIISVFSTETHKRERHDAEQDRKGEYHKSHQVAVQIQNVEWDHPVACRADDLNPKNGGEVLKKKVIVKAVVFRKGEVVGSSHQHVFEGTGYGRTAHKESGIEGPIGKQNQVT